MITKICNIPNTVKRAQNLNRNKILKTESDCFIPSFGSKQKKSIFSLFSSKTEDTPPVKIEDTPATEYQKMLSEKIKEHFECDIPPQNFRNIMNLEEFKELLPSLKAENFSFDKNPQADTLYTMDLDYQSNYSSGEKSMYEILSRVEEYSKKYYENTGKQFIFAITDKDCIDGIQQAIRIIGSNPEKYEHFKFLPAAKFSYAHIAPNSQLGYENSELLVYGIDPFSTSLKKFTEDTIDKRKDMVINFINDLDTAYPEFEFKIDDFTDRNDLNYDRDVTVSNLYWRVKEYAESKGGSAIRTKRETTDKVYFEASELIDNLAQFTMKNNPLYNFGGFEILSDDEDLNQAIRKIFTKYTTHIDENGNVISPTENTYEEVIDCLSKEKETPIVALSSPFYLAHHFEQRDEKGIYHFDNVINFVKSLKDKSKGILTAFESVSPSYKQDKYVKDIEIHTFNKEIKKNFNFYEVGGSLLANDSKKDCT